MSTKGAIERYSPIVITLVIGVVANLYTGGSLLSPSDFTIFQQSLSNSALNIGTSLLGFLLAIYTIIQAVKNEQLDAIRANGQYGRLMSYLRVALYAHALVVGLVLIFSIPSLLKLKWGIGSTGISISLWAATFITSVVWAITTTIRFVSIFLYLIEE